jgi:uncharacterized protein YjdB
MQRPFWNQPRLRRALVSAAVVAVSTVAATACSDSSTEPGGAIVAMKIVKTPLSKPTTNMLRGDSIQLIGVPMNADSNFVNTTVTWTSSDNAKATVDANGLVKTIAGGDVTITAAAGGQTATFPINIQFPVGTVDVNPKAQTIRREGSVTLTATLLGTDGQPAIARTVVWSTSNAAVATVNATTGQVSGVTDGTATITATSEGVAGSTTVTVSGAPLVATVTVASPSTQLPFQAVGSTLQLTQTPKAASGTTITGTTPTWTTSSASIATVSSTGLVTCVAPGSATITSTVPNGATPNVNVQGTLSVSCFTAAVVGAQSVPNTSAGNATFFAFVVPAGTTSMTIALSGGTGDPDLYLFSPTRTPGALTSTGGFAGTNDGISGNSGPSESVTVTNPAAGTWRIAVHAWGGAPAISGGTMTITKTP